jgi:hypothetical protein
MQIHIFEANILTPTVYHLFQGKTSPTLLVCAAPADGRKVHKQVRDQQQKRNRNDLE